MTAVYNKLSPYANTSLNYGFLDVINLANIPAEADDIQFTITSLYMHRPDLLAYDVYGDAQYWWVFAVRNVDVIKDPIYDFITGQVIYLPKITTIKNALGL
jgi:hypothetical protein